MKCFLISGSKLVNPFRFLEVFETWGPYIDGDLIKEQAVTAFQKGHWQKEKSVLLGKTPTKPSRCSHPWPEDAGSVPVCKKVKMNRITAFFLCRYHLRRGGDLCVQCLHEAGVCGGEHRLHHSHL